MMKRALAFTLCAGLTAAVSAQEPLDQVKRRQAVDELTLVEEVKRASAGLAVETRVTRGKPYTGDAVTEFVQALADGNRIVRRSTTRIYRDGDGRTRRETLGDGGELQSIVITDPVAAFSLVLDPATRTAARAGANITSVATIDGTGRTTVRVKTSDVADIAAAVRKREIEKAMAAERAGAAIPKAADSVRGIMVDLGEQSIEGVTARGTRTITVIPAGAIGNEQPLTTISEQWFSTELEVLVMTRHSDPRVGETTYRLTGIVRAEPDKSLFQMPADYTPRK
jgi:hypothetical protein